MRMTYEVKNNRVIEFNSDKSSFFKNIILNGIHLKEKINSY